MMNKVNWNFLLGVIFGMAFITIGLIDFGLTNGGYASGIGVTLMFIWFVGFFVFLRKRTKNKKGDLAK